MRQKARQPLATDRATFRAGQIRSGSALLHYRVAGAGPPLVLIHGFPATSACWTPTLQTLAERYRVYALDLVGFGRSWPKHRFSLRYAVDHIQRWMAALGIARADFCGHSMGGQVCLSFAAAHPERVRKIIAVAPSGLPLEGNAVALARRGMDSCGYANAVTALRAMRPALQAGPLVLLGAVRDIRRANIGEILGAINAPTLVVWGGRDTLLPISHATAFHRAIQGSRLVIIPEGNHNVIWNCAAGFHQAVIEFLDAETDDTRPPARS